MTERTYPREWFLASVWTKQPRAKTFCRETDKSLFSLDSLGNERAVRKVCADLEWFPTIEEAQAKIDQCTAERNERRRMELTRDAAPVMLAAIMDAVAAMRAYLPPDGIGKEEFISRVIGALDNPDINPIILLADEWAKGETR